MTLARRQRDVTLSNSRDAWGVEMDQIFKGRLAVGALFGICCVVGILVHHFLLFVIIAAVLSGMLYAVINRAKAAARQGRERNRDRQRNRG